MDGAVCDDASFQRANFVGTSAVGASFRRCAFYYSRPGSANFSGADLSDTDISRAIFRAADLRGAKLDGAKGSANFDRAKR